MENNFTPHEIVWTYEKVSRFWNYLAHNKAYEDTFFSKQVGDAIIKTILAYHDLRVDILDYGCGHGHLLWKLLKRGIPAEGLDFSEDSVKLIERKFCKEKLFKGVTLAKELPTSLESDKFDFVFFIAAIEHVLTEDLRKTLREIHRITRNGGYVFVATANEENLEMQKILCPECGCIFHKVQHISSWTRSSLSSVMKDSSFSEVLCAATRLRESGVSGLLRHIMINIELKVFRKKQPHLIYIGRKQ